MAELTTGQSIKQAARATSLAIGDRVKVASAKTSGSSNKARMGTPGACAAEPRFACLARCDPT